MSGEEGIRKGQEREREVGAGIGGKVGSELVHVVG